MARQTTWTEADLADLRRAVRLLEGNNLVVRLTAMFGRTIEHVAAPGMRLLPASAREAIHSALERAFSTAFDAAAKTVGRRTGMGWLDRVLRARWINMVTAMMSGAGGGLAGLPGVIVELPFTTTVLMRAIAQVAAEEGEDVRTAETKLECLQVFALGSPSIADDEADLGYYAVRLGFARALGGLAGRTLNQALPQAMAVTATRFGVPVAYKVAAETVPVIGAAAGAAINALFVDHFQAKARGHFTVRRLEREYGEAEVHREYDAVLDELFP
jgi:hypothetical protein